MDVRLCWIHPGPHCSVHLFSSFCALPTNSLHAIMHVLKMCRPMLSTRIVRRKLPRLPHFFEHISPYLLSFRKTCFCALSKHDMFCISCHCVWQFLSITNKFWVSGRIPLTIRIHFDQQIELIWMGLRFAGSVLFQYLSMFRNQKGF